MAPVQVSLLTFHTTRLRRRGGSTGQSPRISMGPRNPARAGSVPRGALRAVRMSGDSFLQRATRLHFRPDSLPFEHGGDTVSRSRVPICVQPISADNSQLAGGGRTGALSEPDAGWAAPTALPILERPKPKALPWALAGPRRWRFGSELFCRTRSSKNWNAPPRAAEGGGFRTCCFSNPRRCLGLWLDRTFGATGPSFFVGQDRQKTGMSPPERPKAGAFGLIVF
jgi:hypothetical protein